MTAPTEKQIAVILKYGKDVPETIEEATKLISELFGKKQTTLQPGAPPNEPQNEFAGAVDATTMFHQLMVQLNITPEEKKAYAAVFNTARIKK